MGVGLPARLAEEEGEAPSGIVGRNRLQGRSPKVVIPYGDALHQKLDPQVSRYVAASDFNGEGYSCVLLGDDVIPMLDLNISRNERTAYIYRANRNIGRREM